MIAFADSSALVKLYADEQDHEMVRSIGTLVVSALARVEVPAALWRKQRIGELDADDATILTSAFEADYHCAGDRSARFAVVAAGPAILAAAAGIAATRGLRAYDAVQLASALAAREAEPSCERFSCFDAQLRQAAAASGFALAP